MELAYSLAMSIEGVFYVVLQLSLSGETRWYTEPNPSGDPCYGPANAHPPGLGLSCPQPDIDHPARWVRFLAPRPWM